MLQLKHGVLVAALALAACSTVQLRAPQHEVVTKDLVRVEVAKISGDILTFDVFNVSRLKLVILRDKIVLETPTGRRGREPGGSSRYYDVPPGAMHDVQVRFNFNDCVPGQELKVRFDSALLVDGTPVPVAPIPIICG